MAIRSLNPFAERYILEDHTVVTVFTNHPESFPHYHPIKQLDQSAIEVKVHVSLIATTKNEKESVSNWAENVLNGRRLPDEIIIVDSGSTDGTAELLRTVASKSPVPFKIIIQNGVNIAQGRNTAIRYAQFPIIAATDFGCRPLHNWLGYLIYPFEVDNEIQMVGGWYKAVNAVEEPQKRYRWPTLEQIKPQEFIPSSRSIAFKKSVWDKVGGYPEWLTMTGEDTYFAMELKRYSSHWAFVPDAVVEWFAPDDVLTYWRKQYYWSIGDGEAGLNTDYYKNLTVQTGLGLGIAFIVLLLLLVGIFTKSQGMLIVVFLFTITALFLTLFIAQRYDTTLPDLAWEIGAKLAQLFGFFRGARNRKTINQRRRETLKE